MNQSYEFTTDYEWMLEQVDNIIWIVNKTIPLPKKKQRKKDDIEAMFNDIKDGILMKKKEIDL